MSATLINQVKNMSDGELLNVYEAMVQKCSRLLLMQYNDTFSLGIVSKLEGLKRKYSYLEQEINNRKLETTLTISSIDIANLRATETAKLEARIAEIKAL